MRKSFKYRLYPNKVQIQKLELQLNATRSLYNAALEQRIHQYKSTPKFWNENKKKYTSSVSSLTAYDQMRFYPEARISDPAGLGQVPAQTCNAVLDRLHKAYKAFEKRVQVGAGKAAGFPRFKGRDRWDSLVYPTYGSGCKLVKLPSGRFVVRFLNIGLVRVKIDRSILGTIKTTIIKREANEWYVVFSCNNVPCQRLPNTDKQVGIDVGLNTFAMLSTGQAIENPRWYRKAAVALTEAQQSLSRKAKGSNRRQNAKKRVVALHTKIRRQRADFHHKLSRTLVNQYGLIAVEDLNVKTMSKRCKPKSSLPNGLNKSIADAGWSQFLNQIAYKAEEAGRVFVKVKAAGTTSTCSQCGRVQKKTLAERIYTCECGLEINRDLNAAINILRLGQSQQAQACKETFVSPTDGCIESEGSQKFGLAEAIQIV